MSPTARSCAAKVTRGRYAVSWWGWEAMSPTRCRHKTQHMRRSARCDIGWFFQEHRHVCATCGIEAANEPALQALLVLLIVLVGLLFCWKGD